MRDGKPLNASENFYHKPLLILYHQYQSSGHYRMINKFYAGYGHGGGRWSESFNYAPTIFEYRTSVQQIDWEAIETLNTTHESSYILSNGETATGYSYNVLTDFLATHYQFGFISGHEFKVGNFGKFTSGFHYRYFNSYLREAISDLLGGNYFIEDYGWASAGVSGREQIKMVGDVIKVDNSSIINFANLFTHYQYQQGKINAFLAANANINHYIRYDRYNYVSNYKSDPYFKPGYDFKGGIGFNLSHNNQLFFNAGYFSRAPYFKYVFGNFNNVIVKDLQNENNLSFELGNRWKIGDIKLEINLYQINRHNISLLTNEYIQFEDNQQSKAMINGLQSHHRGIDFIWNWMANDRFRTGGFINLGDYRYGNDVSAFFYNNQNTIIDTANIYVNGLKVGGTAQSIYAAFVDIKFLQRMAIHFQYQFLDQLYANFNPTFRLDESDREQSFRLPSYHLLNIRLQGRINLGKNPLLLSVSATNLLDQHYIETGDDGIDHDLESFRGFWSFGRTFNLSMRYEF